LAVVKVDNTVSKSLIGDLEALDACISVRSVTV